MALCATRGVSWSGPGDPKRASKCTKKRCAFFHGYMQSSANLKIPIGKREVFAVAFSSKRCFLSLLNFQPFPALFSSLLGAIHPFARATLITKRHLVLNLSKTNGKPMVLGLSLVVLGGSGGLLGGPLGHPGGPSSAWKPFFFASRFFEGTLQKLPEGMRFGPLLGPCPAAPSCTEALRIPQQG